MEGAPHHKSAFTIIELLVVVVIIGLLTSVASVNYLAAQKRSRDSVRKNSINTIASAIETYYSQNHKFPGKSMLLDTNGDITEHVTAGCEDITPLQYTQNGATINANVPLYAYRANLTTDCSSLPAVVAANPKDSFTPSDFSPAPTWIPGLGNFLNPVPTEPRFLGYNGSSDTTDTFIDYLCSDTTGNAGCGTQTSNKSRSFVYRKLVDSNGNTGYAVYARLENTDNDSVKVDANNKILSNDTTSGLTPLPPGLDTINSTSSNPITIYMIRK